MKIDEFAKKTGNYPYHFVGEWNDYKVWQADIYNEPLILGAPYVILEKGEEIRMSNEDEAWEIASFFDNSRI